MGKIEKILKKGPVEGQTTEVYPVTSTKAVYDENNKRLDNIITGLQESVYLNNPIPISTEDTPEANAQNVKNITNYIEKAKAAGIEDVNGMAVTCIINDAYSGVGYIMGNTDVAILGIKITDDLVNNTVFIIYGGMYFERTVITVGTSNKVDSDMLNEGARKPIILTPNTTEVDEETYQKLLSDDVDVVFKLSETVLLPLQGRNKSDTYLYFYFSFINFDADALDVYDSTINAVSLLIKSSTPHTVSSSVGEKSFDTFLANYIDTSIAQSLLQEIDLSGTDADRKAKLDQFANNWKTLIGADTLDGARFVGYVDAEAGREKSVLFTYNYTNDYWSGVNSSLDGITSVIVNPYGGSLIITPLFSHLEAITLKASNTNEDMAANVATIKAYIDNLTDLGVDTTKGFMVSVNVNIPSDSGYYGYMASHYVQGNYFLSGTIFKNSAGENYVKNITINPMGRYDEIVSTAS